MELNLQPLAPTCRASGRAFADGDRVVSYLVRTPLGEMARHDLLAVEDANFRPEGTVLCRWTNVFKPRPSEENRDRVLKLTAENLFVTLADPANEPNPVNTPLLQFLALLLERKRPDVRDPGGRSQPGVLRQDPGAARRTRQRDGQEREGPLLVARIVRFWTAQPVINRF